jgi:plastocyanin
MRSIYLLLLAFLAAPAASLAAEEKTPPVALVLKDHKFEPAVIEVPAGQRIRIELANKDASSDEFDSVDLKVEKEVTPHSKVVFFIGPLQPGTYKFMGELHPDTAQGEVHAVAKP